MEPANRRQFCANCRVFFVLSTATWDSENQDVSHDFEGFHLKKQNVEVKKGIGLYYVVRIFIHFDGAI